MEFIKHDTILNLCVLFELALWSTWNEDILKLAFQLEGGCDGEVLCIWGLSLYTAMCGDCSPDMSMISTI